MKIINIKRASLALAAIAMLGMGSALTSCDNDDDAKVELNFLEGYGPLPIGRGETLTFFGKDLSKVQYVEFQNGTRVEVSRIDKTKFTITVPNDVAPGVLKLMDSNGNVICETVTPCKFNEPIELISATPSDIKVGDELTITGKYLYQARSVKFAGDVVVSLDDSLPEKRTIRNWDNSKDSVITVYVTNPYKVSQEDGAIVVKVPGTALSGKVGLNDIDDNDFFSDKLVLNITAPKVTSFEDKVYKQGIDKVSFTGKDLDLVKSIVFDGAEVTEFTGSESSISFPLPATVKSGEFSIVTESGVSVPVAEIKVVEPTAEVVEKEFLGKSLTITGTDLDFIKEVKVGGAVIEKPTITAESITFVIPDNATDGITLTPANGKAVELEFDAVPADFADECFDSKNIGTQLNFTAGVTNTYSGTNLNKVKDIIIDGLSVLNLKSNDDGTTLSFDVPGQIQGWKADGVKVVYVNGEQGQYNFWVNGSSAPFISDMPKSIVVGNSFLVQGGNLQKTAKVFIGDDEVTFSVANDSKMFIYVPTSVPEGDYYIVIKDADGSSISSYNKIKVAGVDPIVLWESKDGEAPGWNENVTVPIDLAGPLTSTSKVIIHLDIDQDATTAKGYGYLVLVQSGWGKQWQENLSKDESGNWNSEVVFQFADKVISHKTPEEEVENPVDLYNGGFFICGGEATYKIKKITVYY